MRKPQLRFRGLVLVFFFLVALASPVGSGTVDLGLTPSHVFSLWTNINDSLIAAARVISRDAALVAAVNELEPEQTADKNPTDVLDHLVIYRAKLDRLLRAQNLPETEWFRPAGDAVTPSDVYLNSANVLNAQLRWLIKRTGPEQTVSQFYARHGFSGKSPSDVFGMVDLASRRIDLLLDAAGL